MRLASVRHDGALSPALLHDDAAYLVEDLFHVSAGRSCPVTTGGAAAIITAGRQLVAEVARLADRLPLLAERGDLTPYPPGLLAAPVPRPPKIICVGRNYAEHAREVGNAVPERPILFSKFATAVVGPYDDIVRPREVRDLDYEAELCVVIGTGGRHIPRDRALEHVAGYCCANDVSARSAQLFSGDQWLRGKSFDTFCPIGPAITTRDDVRDPQALRITCRVDGEVRQDDTTANMVFDVATLIGYCSEAFTLEPGDILLTGTPAGVAIGRQPPPWLEPGQLCEVEVETVGRMANRITDDATLSPG